MCLPVSHLFWVSSLAYPNLFGTKGYIVVVVFNAPYMCLKIRCDGESTVFSRNILEPAQVGVVKSEATAPAAPRLVLILNQGAGILAPGPSLGLGVVKRDLEAAGHMVAPAPSPRLSESRHSAHASHVFSRS
jgi:hypothetical protein